MARHNKKRNTGLIYEFLARFIASAIVENNETKRAKALEIVNEHFRKGTELYREFRLFNALISTCASSDSVASSIIREAKDAARRYDSKKLDYEKSMLIRSINHNLNVGGDFYNQPVSEYKEYATVAQLLAEWRKQDFDLAKMAEYEEALKSWLLKPKQSTQLSEHVSDDTNALVLRIMIKKFNEKYKDLGDQEREILKAYVFQEHRENLVPRLKELKVETITGIDNYLQKEELQYNKMIVDKLTKVKEAILNESIEEVNDETIEHFLDIAKLKEELDV